MNCKAGGREDIKRVAVKDDVRWFIGNIRGKLLPIKRIITRTEINIFMSVIVLISNGPKTMCLLTCKMSGLLLDGMIRQNLQFSSSSE